MVPADHLDEATLSGRDRVRPLDLRREMARYGADTPGGIGVSRAATSIA